MSHIPDAPPTAPSAGSRTPVLRFVGVVSVVIGALLLVLGVLGGYTYYHSPAAETLRALKAGGMEQLAADPPGGMTVSIPREQDDGVLGAIVTQRTSLFGIVMLLLGGMMLAMSVPARRDPGAEGSPGPGDATAGIGV